MDRSGLLQRRFGLFVSPTERSEFNSFIESVFTTGTKRHAR